MKAARSSKSVLRALALGGLVALLGGRPGLASAGPKDLPEPPALAAGELASLDVLGGGSDPGAWAIGLRGGWPWFGLRFQAGMKGGWTPLADLDSALGRRWDLSLGVGKRILDHPRGRLSAEVLLGWQFQTGQLEQRGPSGAIRLRLAGIVGRVNPWLAFGGRHTLLLDRTRVITADGTNVTWSARYRWSPHLAFGVVVGITKHVGFDVGIDWHFVDVGTVAVSLPGVHLGLQFGGGR